MSSRIMVVLGTRPEAIKLAPLIKELRQSYSVTICSTGQHKEMLASALEAFGLVPDIDLNLMTHDQSLASISAQTLEQLDRLLGAHSRFDAMVVQGDTTTCTFAGLAAFYRQVPLFHVEAGLRSHSLTSPFPEEFNRRVVGLVTKGHFSPTEAARQNLLNEGVSESDILVTGNTGIDALRLMRNRLAQGEVTSKAPVLADRFVLVTLHRRESFGQPLENLLQGIRSLAENHNLHLAIPLHMNPKVRQTARNVFQKELGRLEFSGGGSVTLMDPLDYPSFTSLLLRCSLIITDSGGVQEEAATLGKPLLICRDRTERNEALAQPGVVLVNPLDTDLGPFALQLLENKNDFPPSTIFGDGQASSRIRKGLAQFFNSGHIN